MKAAFPRRLFDMSFRVKLLLALVGSVSTLGLASLAVVQSQTARQIDWMVARTTERTQRALGELETFRRAELARLAQRLTGSIRIVAALDAALESDDAADFVEHVRYELALAELVEGLVAFRDRDGRPVERQGSGGPGRGAVGSKSVVVIGAVYAASAAEPP